MNHHVTLSCVVKDTQNWDKVMELFTKWCLELGDSIPQMSVSSVDLDMIDDPQEPEYTTLETTSKVGVALREQGFSDEQTNKAIIGMQRYGILFRERT